MSDEFLHHVSRDDLQGQPVSEIMDDANLNNQDDEDGESVYMIDNVIMRKIQIEGEEG